MNSQAQFRYNDKSGLRATFGCYSGLWYVEWPVGAPAKVHFSTLDPHVLTTDIYLSFFQRRVDKCMQMTAGVLVAPAPSSFKCAFPGRRLVGR